MLKLRLLSALAATGWVAQPPATAEKPQVERVETSAGAFLVRDAAAADFRKLLAGESTQHRYYAGGDDQTLDASF